MQVATPAPAAPVNLHDFTRGVAIRTDVAARLRERRRILSDDQLRRIAPSIFATEPWEGMSDRYSFVPTSRVVEAMRSAGFMPVHAEQSRARLEGKGEYAKHMVRFRPEGADVPAFVGDTFPELVLVNSHDGGSGFQLRAGLFRLVCNNGAIIESGSIGQVKVRHTGRVLDDVIEGTGTLIREVPKVGGLLDRMVKIRVEREQALALANAARALRWDDGEHCPIKADDLIRPRRTEDRAPDLWTVYNVIQEAILRGGLHGKGSTGRNMTTRAVASVSENVRLNVGLWNLAEEAAQILA